MTAECHPATIYRGEVAVATTDDNASLAVALEQALLDAVG
jgi:hypothetical protein